MKNALEQLKAAFPAERWAWIERRARMQGLGANGLQALCMSTLETSTAWHPGNEAAALAGAQNRLIIHLGGVLKDEDVKRFEAALKSQPKKPRKGGQHDAAPVKG
jgi:hypothetical protein